MELVWACQGTSCFSPRTDDNRRPFTPCGRITSDALILPCRMSWVAYQRMTEYACFQKLKILEYIGIRCNGHTWTGSHPNLDAMHPFLFEGERESELRRLRMLDCAAIAKWAATSAWFSLVMFWVFADVGCRRTIVLQTKLQTESTLSVGAEWSLGFTSGLWPDLIPLNWWLMH